MLNIALRRQHIQQANSPGTKGRRRALSCPGVPSHSTEIQSLCGLNLCLIHRKVYLRMPHRSLIGIVSNYQSISAHKPHEPDQAGEIESRKPHCSTIHTIVFLINIHYKESTQGNDPPLGFIPCMTSTVGKHKNQFFVFSIGVTFERTETDPLILDLSVISGGN